MNRNSLVAWLHSLWRDCCVSCLVCAVKLSIPCPGARVHACVLVCVFLPGTHKLLETMRKQKAPVEGISIIGTDKEGVIAKSDGAHIIWGLVEASSRPLNTHISLFVRCF